MIVFATKSSGVLLPRRCCVLSAKKRRGGVVVLGVFALLAMLCFVGFAIDLGNINLVKSRMQATADSIALASIQEIRVSVQQAAENGGNGSDIDFASSFAKDRAGNIAREIAALNEFHLDLTHDLQFGRRELRSDGTYEIQWNTTPYNVVRARIRLDNPHGYSHDSQLKLIFAPFYREKTIAVAAEAIAYIEPRDIVAVLDYSESMSFETGFRPLAVKKFGLSAVERGLDDVWKSLSSSGAVFSDDPSTEKFPTKGFGKLNTYNGGHYSGSGIDAVFTHLRLGFGANMAGQSFAQLRHRDRRIVFARPRNPGKIQNRFAIGSSSSNSDDYIPFPQEGRSADGTFKGKPNKDESEQMWKDYIKWVRDNENYGYRKRYNLRTLMAYLIQQRLGNERSEDLWRAPIYPFHATKQGMSANIEFLEAIGFGDQLGLISYATSARRETELWDDSDMEYVHLRSEHLTTDFEDIDTIHRHKMAGHYDRLRNLGDGLLAGRELLDEQKRRGASPIMLVLSNGIPDQAPDDFGLPANWNWNALTDFNSDGAADYWTNERPKEWAFFQAKLAIDAGYTIHTLAIGEEADRDLLEAIAFASGGDFVHVPRVSSHQELNLEVQSAFIQLAGHVPTGKLLTTSGN